MVSLRRGISTTSSILDKSKVVVEAVEMIVSVAGELDGVEDGEGVTGVAAAAGLLSKDEISSPSLPIMANRSYLITNLFMPGSDNTFGHRIAKSRHEDHFCHSQMNLGPKLR